jgi:hypothetical protein
MEYRSRVGAAGGVLARQQRFPRRPGEQAGTQYSEMSVIESKTRGVLDTHVRGYDGW